MNCPSCLFKLFHNTFHVRINVYIPDWKLLFISTNSFSAIDIPNTCWFVNIIINKCFKCK